MYKILTAAAITILSSCNPHATPDKNPAWDITVYFGSKCCGTSKDGFLKNFFEDYKYKNQVHIYGYKLERCGKEGEFYILFSVKNLKKTQKETFIKALEDVVQKQESLQQAANNSYGNINVQRNVIPQCNSSLLKW